MKNCVICNTPFEKGIGKVCCSRTCHNRRINSLRDYSNTQATIKKLARIEEYNKNPKKCAHHSCETILNYKCRSNKYCSQSCSAKITNTARNKSIYDNQAEKMRQVAINKGLKPRTILFDDKVIHIRKLRSLVLFPTCQSCNNIFSARHRSTRFCSDACKANSSITSYRRACKFNISKINNPELFNEDLLRRFGMYRASNHPDGYNPNGATWDHLFRAIDGYKLGIPPSIMSHPANAEMVSWRENISRSKSVITYDQLLIRIKEYDNRKKNKD